MVTEIICNNLIKHNFYYFLPKCIYYMQFLNNIISRFQTYFLCLPSRHRRLLCSVVPYGGWQGLSLCPPDVSPGGKTASLSAQPDPVQLPPAPHTAVGCVLQVLSTKMSHVIYIKKNSAWRMTSLIPEVSNTEMLIGNVTFICEVISIF